MLQFKETRPYYWLMLGALVIVTMIFVAIRTQPRSATGCGRSRRMSMPPR